MSFCRSLKSENKNRRRNDQIESKKVEKTKNSFPSKSCQVDFEFFGECGVGRWVSDAKYYGNSGQKVIEQIVEIE